MTRLRIAAIVSFFALPTRREPRRRARARHAGKGEQIGGVGLVEHGEVGVEPERPPVPTQQAVGDGVEGAAPRSAARRRGLLEPRPGAAARPRHGD